MTTGVGPPSSDVRTNLRHESSGTLRKKSLGSFTQRPGVPALRPGRNSDAACGRFGPIGPGHAASGGPPARDAGADPSVARSGEVRQALEFLRRGGHDRVTRFRNRGGVDRLVARPRTPTSESWPSSISSTAAPIDRGGSDRRAFHRSEDPDLPRSTATRPRSSTRTAPTPPSACGGLSIGNQDVNRSWRVAPMRAVMRVGVEKRRPDATGSRQGELPDSSRLPRPVRETTPTRGPNLRAGGASSPSRQSRAAGA